MKSEIFISRAEGETFTVRIATPRVTQLLDADENVSPGGQCAGMPYARIAELGPGRHLLDLAKEAKAYGKAIRGISG